MGRVASAAFDPIFWSHVIATRAPAFAIASAIAQPMLHLLSTPITTQFLPVNNLALDSATSDPSATLACPIFVRSPGETSVTQLGRQSRAGPHIHHDFSTANRRGDSCHDTHSFATRLSQNGKQRGEELT